MSRFLAIPVLFFFALFPILAEGHTISGPEVRLVNKDIFVSFSFIPDEKTVQEIQNGLDKEFSMYIDLFRAWQGWSDEFITGKFSSRTLKCDPIKKEFLSSSFDGQTIVEKRYRSFGSMIGSALVVRDLKLANIRELEPGQYFVRITVESKLRRLPPIIGHILLFVRDNEFKIRKDSGLIQVEGVR